MTAPSELAALADELIQQAKNRTDHFRPKTYRVTLEYRAAQVLRHLAASPSAMKEACKQIALDHTPAKFDGTLAAHVVGMTIAAAIDALDVAALDAPAKEAAAPAAGEDWEDDPSADERWNAGLDYAMVRFCKALGVDPKKMNWDAATEELEGDVLSVIGNIMRAKYGEDWSADAPPLQAPAHSDAVREAAISFLSSFRFTVCEKSFYKDAYLNITRPDKSCCYRLSSDSTASEDIAGIERKRAEILAALTAPAIKDTKPVAYRQISKSSGSVSFSETQLDDTEFNRGRWTEDALYLSATPALTAPAAKAPAVSEADAKVIELAKGRLSAMRIAPPTGLESSRKAAEEIEAAFSIFEKQGSGTDAPAADRTELIGDLRAIQMRLDGSNATKGDAWTIDQAILALHASTSAAEE